MAEEIKDDTKVDVTDPKGDDKDKSSQIDQGEFEQAKESAKALTDLLEDHGFDSKEDLMEALSSGKDLKGKIGDVNIEDALAKAKKLDSYEQYWAAQDTKTKHEDETSDERVDRIEKRLDASEAVKKQEALKKSQLEEGEKALDTYGKEVKGVLENTDGISEDYRPFVSEFLGVNNPANEVDITNQNDVRKMAKEGVKKVEDFEQAVIKRYREGKIKVPEITKTEPTDVDAIKERQPKNLAESKKMTLEILTKQLLGRA